MLNQLSIIIGGTQIITYKRKTHLFYKIIHFSVQFSTIVNRFIVKTLLNSSFTNDLKENKKKIEKYQKLQTMQL